MLAIKVRYNGTTVILDSKPPIKECDVIVNFPDIPAPLVDDSIREPIVDFGNAVKNYGRIVAFQNH